MTILGAANWVYRWYRPGGEHTPEEIAAGIASLTVDGLAVEGTQHPESEEHVASLHG
jgi:hypothetical protein